MSAGCWTQPIVRASPPPPLACLLHCRVPPPLVPPGDQAARTRWEHEVLRQYGECYDLHEDCAEAHRQRINEQ